MTPAALPLPALVVVLPLAWALLTGLQRRPLLAWRLAIAGAALELGLAVGLALLQRAAPEGALADPLLPRALGVDGLSAPLLVFQSALALALVVGWPRERRTPRLLGALLASEGALALLFVGLRLDVVCLAWTLSFVPALATRGEGRGEGASGSRARRPLLVLAVASSLPLLVALALAGGGADGGHLFGPGPRRAVLALVIVAACARTAVFPLHGWLLPSFGGGDLVLPLFLLSARPGVYLLLRAAADLSAELAEVHPLLLALGACGAVYGGLLALAQTDLRRLAGALAISHSGLIATGVFSGTRDAGVGSFVLWVNVGLGLAGLALVGVALEARFGRERLLTARGIGTRLPGLAGAFLLCGACCVGFPATLGFVGEELVIRAVLREQPVSAAALVLATALNGMALMRAYLWLFLGPAPADLPAPPSLRPRERAVLATLGLALVLFGLRPGLLVEAGAAAAVAVRLRPDQDVPDHP
ncbi:MAG: proton-conducting transporter membrane subunit [Planctomycetota bacterium]